MLLPAGVCPSNTPQRELTSKVQRIDALQGELNTSQADKAAAEAAAAEAKDAVVQLQSSLVQAQRQVDILGNNTDSKETQLQQLRAELDGAHNAKTSVELQARHRQAARTDRHRRHGGSAQHTCCNSYCLRMPQRPAPVGLCGQHLFDAAVVRAKEWCGSDLRG
jgi:hypothetical protein